MVYGEQASGLCRHSTLGGDIATGVPPTQTLGGRVPPVPPGIDALASAYMMCSYEYLHVLNAKMLNQLRFVAECGKSEHLLANLFGILKKFFIVHAIEQLYRVLNYIIDYYFCCYYYAAVLQAALRVLPVRLSVRPSIPYGLLTRKQKRRKIKIDIDIPQFLNFQLKGQRSRSLDVKNFRNLASLLGLYIVYCRRL